MGNTIAIYGKVNFNVPLLPPDTCEVWDYKNAKLKRKYSVISFWYQLGFYFPRKNY